MRDLEALLNYLEVDEGHYFKWNTEFLELFTLSELESLAGEVGLKAKMGAAFKLARAKKKGDFIKSLLAVPGFSYEGTVPTVMQYLRRVVPAAPVAVVEEEALAARAPQPLENPQCLRRMVSKAFFWKERDMTMFEELFALATSTTLTMVLSADEKIGRMTTM